MAIDTPNKRRTAINRRLRGLGHANIPDGGLNNNSDRRAAAIMYSGIGLQRAFLFDVRIFNRAISESGGQAVDDTNLGTISYVFDDMLNNDGKAQLPFG